MVLVIAVLLAISRHLFVSVMLFGFLSLLSAALFMVMDAPDVAFTEAAVGAGLSTVLLLAVIAKKSRRIIDRPPRPRMIAVAAAMAALTALLIESTLGMPPFGDPSAPANLHVAGDYLSRTRADVGIDNAVTAVLASYRGFDTLGELFVIFIAGIGALAIHAAGDTRKRQQERHGTH